MAFLRYLVFKLFFDAIVQWSFFTALFLFLFRFLRHCHSLISCKSLQNFFHSLKWSLLCSTFYDTELNYGGFMIIQGVHTVTRLIHRLYHQRQVYFPAVTLRICSCWVCSSSRCSQDSTVTSLSSLPHFIFIWFLGHLFTLIPCTCPVYIYSCYTYLSGCFSGHVFYSTRNIETSSAREHRSSIVVCI